MTAAELDATTVAALEPYAQPRLSVLLGAGASIAAGLPSWETLAERLLIRTGISAGYDAARRLLASQDPLLIAEAARARTSDWAGVLREALYGPDPEPDPAVLHLAAAGLAAGRAPGDVTLHTLNFDPLLGNALRGALAELDRPVAVHERWAPPAAPPDTYSVNHLHGLLGREVGGVTGLVLTLSDYLALEAQPHPWQVSALQEGLSKGPLIMAGTSYRDPDLRQWLHDLDRVHPVVVLLARQGLDLDRDSFTAVRSALRSQWEAIHVMPVFVQDYADAAQALREIPHLQEPGYQPPQARAGEMFGDLLADFQRHQLEHSDQLGGDLEQLRPHLGSEANLTLWLADGAGRLVRWAAPDRVYRTPGSLRSVTPGYDSPWVAGDCLGRDDVVVNDLTEHQRGATQRWRTVVAAPVPVELSGGPAFSAAVLSSASTLSLDQVLSDDWTTELKELASAWGSRLASA